jgi:tetratricopeptide (TPR) repeat protein
VPAALTRPADPEIPVALVPPGAMLALVFVLTTAVPAAGGPIVVTAPRAVTRAAAGPLAAGTKAAPAPPLPPSPVADSAESAPAPLLVPGRAAVDTVSRNRRLHAREQYEKGLEFERGGVPAAAIASYRNAALLDSTIEDANYRAGMLFLTVGQVGEAVRHFAAEVIHHPGRVDAARQLGLGLARLGEHARAIAQLELLTQRRPTDGESWRALGFAYSLAGRPRDAEDALRRAIALPPPQAGEHRDLGALLVTEKRTDEARIEYQRAMKIDPHDATVWINLANLERAQRRPEPALKAYHEAERRDSTLLLALEGQVAVLHELHREAEAGAVYRRLLRARPGDLSARLDAVRLFDQLGRKDVALELARDGVRFDRKSGEARLVLGMALQAGGDTRSALVQMREAERLSRTGGGRDRARRLIASLRTQAPDSLKALFEADSLAHPVPAAGTDSSGASDSTARKPQ